MTSVAWRGLLVPVAVAFASLVMLVCGALHYGSVRETRVARARDAARDAAREGADEMGRQLRELVHVADATAEALSQHDVTDAGTRARIQRLMNHDPNIAEIGIAYRELALTGQERLHGEALTFEDGSFTWSDLDARLDYERPGVEWFHRPIEEGPVWIAQVQDVARDVVRAVYARGFVGEAGGPEPSGVVYVACSTAGMRRMLEGLDLGDKGYGYVVSGAGRYIIHPNEMLVRSGASVFDERGPGAGRDRAAGALSGQVRSEAAVDPLTQRPSWFFYEPIDEAGWTLVAVAILDDAMLDPDIDLDRAVREERRTLMHLATLAGLLAVSLVLAIVRIGVPGRRGLWALSIGFSVACLSVAFALVAIARSVPDSRSRSRIANGAALARFHAEQNERVLEMEGRLPLFVPTGVYVQSASFLSANEVQLTGYVWQIYEDGVHDGIERRFAMPESASGEFHYLPPERDPPFERHVCRFTVVLNQDFDYSRYPLGDEDLWLQLWHEDFSENVILVPDLDSYTLTSPGARPGLKEGLDLPGWDIEGSYFSHREHTYQTSFGADSYAGLTDFPELYFNIAIRKQLTGPLISDFLPLTVVAILMFTILMLSSRRDPEMTLSGFSGMNVIAACGGFFLVVIFSHIGLRASLAVKDFVYIEYFYFLSYVLILLVSINSLMYSRLGNRWVVHGENLTAQLLYWPLTAVAILGCNWWALY